MVQEDQALAGKVAAMERRIKDLERLLTLGLVGGDIETTLRRHSALLGKLIGDDTLGNIMTGPFASADSSMSYKRTGDSSFYPGGALNQLASFLTGVIGANLLWAIPFYVPRHPNVVDEIGIEVVLAEVGKNARLGIYASRDNVYPGELLFDLGTVTMSPFEVKTLPVDESLPRGLYWLVIVSDSTTGTVKLVGATQAGVWAILGTLTVGQVGDVGWRVAHTYGPLPAVYPSGAARLVSAPGIWLSFKPGGWS